MKLGSFSFLGPVAECLFNKATGFDALAAGEPFGFNGRVAFNIDQDFNSLIQAAPPTWTVSLTEPLSSRCSLTECPFFRASILTRSVA